jgi:hypothetical protein
VKVSLRISLTTPPPTTFLAFGLKFVPKKGIKYGMGVQGESQSKGIIASFIQYPDEEVKFKTHYFDITYSFYWEDENGRDYEPNV